MIWRAVCLTAYLLEACTSVDAFQQHEPPSNGAVRPPPTFPHLFTNCTTTSQHEGVVHAASATLQPTAPSSRATSRLRPQASGCDSRGTVNAVNATLKWWYTESDSVAASTVSLQYDTDDQYIGWTIIPATTTYDTVSAILTSSCSAPYYTGTYANTPYTLSLCETRPTHVAATTSPLFREAFKTPSYTTGASKDPIPNLQTTPPPAKVVLARQTFSTGTPFVQFSEYEVVKCTSRRNDSYQFVTQSYKLASPYAFEYTGPDPARVTDADAPITGTLDSAFPAYINRTSLAPGSWSAPPTVIVVVDRILVAVAVLAATARIESSATALLVPGPILPPGYSQVPPTNPPRRSNTDIYPTARVEETQSWLLLPGSTTSVGEQQITTQAQPGSSPQGQPSTTSMCSSRDCPAPAQPVVVAGTTLTPQEVPAYVAEDKTAYKGGDAITCDGRTLSALANGNSIVVWDGTITKTMAAATSGAFTVDGMQVTATSGMIYYGSDQTLFPGGSAVTIHGISMSVAPSGGLQIGGQATTTDHGIATHIIDGMGGTTMTSSTSSAASSSGSPTSGNGASSHGLSNRALWLTVCVAVGSAWLIG